MGGLKRPSGPFGQLLLMSPCLETLKVTASQPLGNLLNAGSMAPPRPTKSEFLGQGPGISIFSFFTNPPLPPAPSAVCDEDHTWRNTASQSISDWSEQIKQNQQHPSACQVHIHNEVWNVPLSLKGLQSNWEIRDTLWRAKLMLQ